MDFTNSAECDKASGRVRGEVKIRNTGPFRRNKTERQSFFSIFFFTGLRNTRASSHRSRTANLFVLPVILLEIISKGRVSRNENEKNDIATAGNDGKQVFSANQMVLCSRKYISTKIQTSSI